MSVSTITYPHDISTERSVLGSQLLSREAIVVCCEHGLTAEDYYVSAHQELQRAILAVFDRGVDVDTITVAAELRRTGNLDRCGGPGGIGELVTELATSADPGPHVEVLRTMAVRRRLLRYGLQVAEDAARDDYEGDLTLDTPRALSAILEPCVRSEAVSLGKVLPQAFEEISNAARGILPGIPTGYTELDRATGGLHRGDLVVIAGRPSMGKSALASGLTRNVAGAGYRAVCFSLEMPRVQLAHRWLASEAKISLHAMRNGYLPKRDMPKLSSIAGTLYNLSIIIDDTPGVTLEHVRSVCLRHEPFLVVIDYVQLMGTSDKRGSSRDQLLGEIMRGLKSLAKELGAAVVCLSQLSRECEKRKPFPRPMLSDLRECGSIEQDADDVLFCYRPEYYGFEKDDRSDKVPIEGRGEVIIGKQRNGPTGTIDLQWCKDWASFENRVSNDQDDDLRVWCND